MTIVYKGVESAALITLDIAEPGGILQIRAKRGILCSVHFRCLEIKYCRTYEFFMLLMVVSQDYQILFPGERRAISV